MTDEKVKIFWISGSYYHSKEILEKIKTSIGKASIEIYDDDVSAEYLEMQLQGSGLFYDTRLIILKDLPSYKGSSTKSNERWQETLKQISEGCVVVILGVSPGTKRVLYKFVKEIGKIFDFPKSIKRVDAPNYIEQKLSEKNKNITGEAVNVLIKKVGEKDSEGLDVDQLYIALEQLCLFVGKKRKNITIEDVLMVVTDNFNTIIWDLFFALDERNFAECEKLLYSMSKSGSVDEAVNQICNMLLWRFRLMFLIKEQKSIGVKDDDITQNILKLKKLTKEESGFSSTFKVDENKNMYSENVVNNMVKGFYSKKSPVEKHTRTEIFKFVKTIHENILKLRLCENDIEKLLVVDNLFLSLCKVEDVSEETLGKMRELINV